MEQAEIDLHEIVRVIRRRWWVLLTLPLVAALVAGLVSLFVIKPVYEASTTMWVVKEGAGPISYNDVLLNRNLTKTYAEVARSRAVILQVIEGQGLTETTVEGLQAKLTVTPVRDTEILKFAVRDRDPQKAIILASAVAEAFRAQITKSIKVDNVTIVDPAQVNPRPVSPRPLMNVALAGVLGGMVALGLVFLLEYLDTTVKTPDDVARHVGLPVLGVIPIIVPPAQSASPPPGRRSRARSNQTQAVVEK